MHKDGPRDADLLIVAAHAPDMAGLRPFLGDSLIGDVRGLHVRGKAIGIGMAAAGPATARGLLALKPRAAILIGSCGVYPNLPQYQPHDVMISNKISLVSHAVNAGRSEFPAPMQTSVDCDPMIAAGLQAGGGRVFKVSIASTLARTVDDTVAASVHPMSGCEAENLEAFAVALACRAAKVPFLAVLGVSNIVGSTGAKDWQQFQRGSVNAAGTVLMKWIEQGAQGLPHG